MKRSCNTSSPSSSSLPVSAAASTSNTTSYIGRPWTSPLVKQIHQMRKSRPRKQTTLGRIVVALYVVSFVALGTIHVAFLRTQHVLSEFDAAASQVDPSSPAMSHDYASPQRKLEDVAPPPQQQQHIPSFTPGAARLLPLHGPHE